MFSYSNHFVVFAYNDYTNTSFFFVASQDSTGQTVNESGGGDWQEETYQKVSTHINITNMKL